MFTGLIETTAKVLSLQSKGAGLSLVVNPIEPFEVNIGDSVSVDGVCLTAVIVKGVLSFDVSPETIRHTTLGNLRTGSIVNLERALRPTDRLGGHIVTGHIDAVGGIKTIKQTGEYTFVVIQASPEVLKYVVKKGSIAIDGISLTVNGVSPTFFSLAIIPHTLRVTSLKNKRVGDRVNIETDIIGKYVARLISMESGKGEGDLWKTLFEAGYL